MCGNVSCETAKTSGTCAGLKQEPCSKQATIQFMPQKATSAEADAVASDKAKEALIQAHRELAGMTLRAEQAEQRLALANRARNSADAEIARLTEELRLSRQVVVVA